LAIVTPSSQTSGLPHFFSISTQCDFGPSVTRTASASVVAPARIFVRAWARNMSCVCAISVSPFGARARQSRAQRTRTRFSLSAVVGGCSSWPS
jgi:hypothetical protein